VNAGTTDDNGFLFGLLRNEFVGRQGRAQTARSTRAV
jgi:hypothetical protein